MHFTLHKRARKKEIDLSKMHKNVYFHEPEIKGPGR